MVLIYAILLAYELVQSAADHNMSTSLDPDGKPFWCPLVTTKYGGVLTL